MHKNNKKSDSLVKKVIGIIWYFLMGTESVYHLFKGLYLTAFFTIYLPFMNLMNSESSEHGVVGATLFSLEEWIKHFQFGIRGPMVLFTSYLLYKYTIYLSPFKKKHNHRGGNRPSYNKNNPNKTSNFQKNTNRGRVQQNT
ncbi:hypothetical protein MJH12_06225 [bacterium]|nr:hypothetical protein [bacterium]